MLQKRRLHIEYTQKTLFVKGILKSLQPLPIAPKLTVFQQSQIMALLEKVIPPLHHCGLMSCFAQFFLRKP